MTEQEWLTIFSCNLAEMLKESGMTQAELAEEAGLSYASVNYYIRGCKVPGARALINIAHVFGCRVDDLVDFGSMIY